MEGHGHGWPAAASSVAMWTAMMAAMMLPSLAPLLARSARPLVLGLGYLAVWAAVGVVIHAFPPLPLPAGPVLLAAGMLQLTTWKAKHLEGLHGMTVAGAPCGPGRAAALRQGLRVGVCCVRSSAGPTAVMLALGPMDLRVMLLVGTVVTVERLARSGPVVARATGAVAILAGLIALGAS